MIGLAVGGLHTVAGPDHLAALAPLVIGKRRTPFAAFGLGALWGSGHATGQLVVGLGCPGPRPNSEIARRISLGALVPNHKVPKQEGPAFVPNHSVPLQDWAKVISMGSKQHCQ